MHARRWAPCLRAVEAPCMREPWAQLAIGEAAPAPCLLPAPSRWGCRGGWQAQPATPARRRAPRRCRPDSPSSTPGARPPGCPCSRDRRRRFAEVGACPYPAPRNDTWLGTSHQWWPDASTSYGAVDWTKCEPSDWSGQRWLSRAAPAKSAGKQAADFQLPRDGAGPGCTGLLSPPGRDLGAGGQCYSSCCWLHAVVKPVLRV
jgi:hypothetical protein